MSSQGAELFVHRPWRAGHNLICLSITADLQPWPYAQSKSNSSQSTSLSLPLIAILERLTLLVFVKCFGFCAYLSTLVTVPIGIADNMPAHYLDTPQKQTYPLCRPGKKKAGLCPKMLTEQAHIPLHKTLIDKPSIEKLKPLEM
ncbi:hypothetical protein DVH24_004777 [Malus domestica]|uniref:Uncharacterized protein n=1 Tax=Malus domestica TaxID=3750 RepID=A0A498II14_MALDO|nr:hypothetical protein DVH24_004777 [Malus domestica]